MTPSISSSRSGSNSSQPTNQPKNIAALTTIFRRMKTNDNRSKDLFTLPPPPKASASGHSNKHHHHQQPSAYSSTSAGPLQSPAQRSLNEPAVTVELISFDSPPQSPTPTHRSTSSWASSLSFSSDQATTSSSGATAATNQNFINHGSLFGGVGTPSSTATTTTTHSESGFEDDFGLQAAFDPFSPDVTQMPAYGFPSAAAAYGSTTAAPTTAAAKSNSTFWSDADFLDPLCNGPTLVQPEAPLAMPTIIRPVAAKSTMGQARANAMAAPSTQTHQAARSDSRQQRSTNRKPGQQLQPQPSYAIVLYQFDALQEGDLNLMVSIRRPGGTNEHLRVDCN